MRYMLLCFGLIFCSSILSQSLETGIVKFNDCNCKSAVNLLVDTIDEGNNVTILKVSCELPDIYKKISYSLKVVDGEIMKDGYYYYVSMKDSTRYISASYENDTLVSFIYRDRYIRESYYVKHNKLDGPFTEFNNDVLLCSGYYSGGAKTGEWVRLYKDGKINYRGSFMPKTVTIELEHNKLIEIVNYADTISVLPFNKYQQIKEKYNYEDNGVVRFPIYIEFKDGIWLYFDQMEKLVKKELYENGKLIWHEEY